VKILRMLASRAVGRVIDRQIFFESHLSSPARC
jgi:hypothetical protein